MRAIRESRQIIRDNLRAYVLLNVMAYGLLAIGLVLGYLFPDLNAAMGTSMDEDGTTQTVGSLLRTPWLFALMIFLVNIGTVALAMIVLPSLVVPFSGIAVFAYFAVKTGITLAPVTHNAAMTLIPHSLTMVIEFQAYILLLLGAYALGRSWLWPKTVAADNRRQGYVRGLKRIGWLSVPSLALFVLGAVYEALSLAYLVPQLVTR